MKPRGPAATRGSRRAALDRVAEVLQQRETIGREELESIAAEASPLASAGKAS